MKSVCRDGVPGSIRGTGVVLCVNRIQRRLVTFIATRKPVSHLHGHRR